MMYWFEAYLYIIICMNLEFGLIVEGAPNWRYSSSVGEQDIFDLRSPLILEYLGGSAIEWIVSEGCTVGNTKLPKTTLKCTAGLHKVTLKEGTISSSNLITFKRNFACYRWHVALNSTIFSHWDTEHNRRYILKSVNVWIVDESWASEEEIKSTAKLPSESSKRLTHVFYKEGQSPEIRLDVHRSTHAHDIFSSLSGYNQEMNCWVFFIDAEFPDYNVDFHITGKLISRYQCSVANTVVLMPLPKFLNLKTGNGKIKLTGATATKTKLFRDPCACQIIAAVTATGQFFFTQDGFKTASKEVYVNASNLQNPPSSLKVSEVAFIFGYFAIRVDKKVYLVDRREGKLSIPDGLPDSGVQHIVSRYWCNNSVGAGHADNIFAAWNDDVLLIFGLNGVESFRNFILPEHMFHTMQLGTKTVSIIDVVFHQYPGPILGIVAKVAGAGVTKLVVLLFQTKTQTWKIFSPMLDLTNAPPQQQDFKLVFQLSPIDFYLYNKHSVYTAWKGGLSVDPLKLRGCTSTVLATKTDEIKQLIANAHGDVIVLMTSNKVYYGKFGNTDLIKFMEMELTSSDIVFNFDSLMYLYTIQVSAAGVTRRRFPLRNEILGVLYPNNHCVVLQFFHNILDFYVLDMRDRVTLWVMLVFPQIRGNHVELTMTQDLLLENDILTVDEVTHQMFSKGMVAKNKTMTFYEGTNFYGLKDYETQKAAQSGTVVIELHPIQVNLACKPPNQVTTYIQTGCPQGRRMQLRRSAFTENCMTPDKYTIDKKYSRSGVDKLVYYDKAILGCLLQIKNSEDFVPIFDIYDVVGETQVFVSSMDVNFIVWEENGRIDFKYKKTMMQSACRMEAQTWAKMRKLHPNTTDRDVWGPDNYRDCFIDDSMTVGDLSQKYEILNRTSSNAINFHDNHNGIFIFRAKVVDPNYSFCKYEVRFAVNVYGWYAEDRVTPLVVSSTLFLISLLVFVITSYKVFKKEEDALEQENMKVLDEMIHVADFNKIDLGGHRMFQPSAAPCGH